MQRGERMTHERPVWEPLLELLGLELVDDGFENDGLRWPRRDGLKWLHLPSVVVSG